MNVYDSITFKIKDFREKDFNRLASKWIGKEPRAVGNGRFQINWHNLHINYFPNQNLIKCSNSLHVFYNTEIAELGRCNHNDYTYTQMEETINLLQTAFDRPSYEMKLEGRLEYGFNIDTGIIKPFEIIKRYMSIVTTTTNEFYALENRGGKPYEKYCPFTHYSVKCYDKGKSSGLTGTNLFRFEIVNRSSIKTKEVFGKQDISLEDLTDKKIWDRCFNNVINTYDSIRILAFPDDGVEVYAKTLCYAFPTLNKDFRKEFKKHFKVLKLAHDELKNNPSNPHGMVRENLIQKFNYLKSN